MAGKIKKKISKKGGDGLASKVLNLPPELIPKDKQGRYMPYCDYHCHRGIILDENVCQSRRCSHYYKIRIDEDSRMY